MTLLDADITGDACTGSRTPMTGRVRNLASVQSSFDSVEMRFAHDVANPDAYAVGMYVDGQLAQRVASTATNAAAANLSDGQHTCTVLPIALGQPEAPHHGDQEGQRVYLEWTPSADPSTVAYRVYWLGNAAVARGAWAGATSYAVGNLVTHDNRTWYCTVGHTSADVDHLVGYFDIENEYQVGDVVIYTGDLLHYRCLVHHDYYDEWVPENWELIAPWIIYESDAWGDYWQDYDYVTPSTLLATVDQIEIEALQYRRLGMLAGRVSLFGTFTGASAVNYSQCTLLLLASGTNTFSATLYDDPGGTITLGEVTISGGNTAQLPLGIMLTLHDDYADYSDGDGISFRVGPRNWYTTAQLDAGYHHRFAVTALDAAGNESAALAVRDLRVLSIPPTVSATLSWSDPTLTVAPNLTEGQADTYNVYTNWNPNTGTFEQYVNEDAPLASTSWDNNWEFTHTVDGTLRVYLRAVKDGIERDDLTLYSFTLPPTPGDLDVVLGDVSNLALTAIAGGQVRVEWDYRFRDGDDLYKFTVEDGCDTGYGINQWDVLAAAGVGYPVAHYTATLANDYQGDYGWDPVYIRVTAYDATGVSSTPATATVSPDNAAPSFSGTLLGGPQ